MKSTKYASKPFSRNQAGPGWTNPTGAAEMAAGAGFGTEPVWKPKNKYGFPFKCSAWVRFVLFLGGELVCKGCQKKGQPPFGVPIC